MNASIELILFNLEGTSSLSIKKAVVTAKLKYTHPTTLKRLTITIEDGFLARANGKRIIYEIDIPQIIYPVELFPK